MSDSEDESITRQKKPLSEARIAAIEKMKEGRKRSLEAKKKAKEEEKEAKKQIKKKIKMKVEEELNGLSSLPLDDKEMMETLKQNAINPTPTEVNGFTENIKIMPAEQQTEPESEEEVIEIKQPIKRKPKKKKKIVVNNYYEDESSEEEEEIVNNYHKKSKKKKVVAVKEPESEEEEIIEEEYIEEPPPPQLVRQRTYIPNAMAGISFR